VGNADMKKSLAKERGKKRAFPSSALPSLTLTLPLPFALCHIVLCGQEMTKGNPLKKSMCVFRHWGCFLISVFAREEKNTHAIRLV
jgi:hypothetical protein